MYSKSILWPVDGVNYIQRGHETIYTFQQTMQKFTSCLFLEDAKNNYHVKIHSVNSANSNL